MTILLDTRPEYKTEPMTFDSCPIEHITFKFIQQWKEADSNECDLLRITNTGKLLKELEKNVKRYPELKELYDQYADDHKTGF